MGRILNIYPREVIMGICLIEGWGELRGACLHVCVVYFYRPRNAEKVNINVSDFWDNRLHISHVYIYNGVKPLLRALTCHVQPSRTVVALSNSCLTYTYHHLLGWVLSWLGWVLLP